MRSLRPLVVAGVALFFATPAPALDGPELAIEVEGLLQQMNAAMAPAQLLWSPVEVAPEGDALRLRVADLRVDGIDGLDLAMGTVDLRVRESGPGLYTVDDVHLPPRAVVLADGVETGSLALQAERLSATWSAPLGSLTQLDLVLRQVVLQPKLRTTLVADRIGAFLETLPEVNGYGATGLDQAKLSVSLSGVDLAEPSGSLQLGNLSLDLNLQGFDWLALQPLWTILRDQQIAGFFSDETRLRELRRAWIDADPLARSFDYALVVDGLGFVDERKGSVALAHAEMRGVQDAPDRDGLFSSEGAVSAQGLALGGEMAAKLGPYAVLLPQSLSASSRMERAPAGVWAGILFDVISAYTSKDQESALGALLASSESLNQVLAEAGTTMLLRAFTIETPLVKLENKASLRYATGTPFGFVGTWVATLSGLDAALAWTEALPDESVRREASSVILGMRGFGQAIAQADGTTIYRYTIVYPADGAVTLNGFPLDKLFQNALPR